MRTNSTRDCHIDYLLKKVRIPAFEVIRGTVRLTTVTQATLTAAFSIGSSQYVSIPGSRGLGGVRFTATTSQVDYHWPVPHDLDNGMPVYFRQNWTTSVVGTTVSATWTMWIATITSGTTVATSPIVALNSTIPADYNRSSTVRYVLNSTPAGIFGPIATGLQAFQTMPDDTHYLHLVIQPTSTTGISLGANELYWLGMDCEYTPRVTFGDGSNREGRKMQSNLGFAEYRGADSY